MNVLIFTNEIKLGGSELVAMHAAHGLVKKKVNTRLIAARGSADRSLEKIYSIENRVSYCDFPRLRIRNYSQIIQRFKCLVEEVDEFAPDIIHSHGEVPDILTVILKFKIKKRKYVKLLRTVHNERYFSLKYGFLIERFINVFYNHIVVISNRTKQLNGSRKCSLIYNPIRLKNTCIVSKTDQEIKTFGIVGRLSDQKNQIKFLQEFAKISDPSFNKKVLLFGFEPKEFPLSKIPEHFRRNIELKGFVSDIDKLYDEVDALIVPSKYEGLSTVMVEALSRNKAVFSKNVSGVSDLEIASKNLVIFTTSRDFLNKVVSFKFDRIDEDQTSLSHMFDPHKHVERLLGVYQEI